MPMRRHCRSVLCAAFVLGTAVCTSARAQALYAMPGPWVDERNQRFAMESLRGSYSVVSMAYGACRRVCSAGLRTLQHLQALADERKTPLNIVVIGLDPSQDSPADWAEYRVDHKLQRASWKFLSGDQASTADMVRWLGLRTWRYGDHLMHDFRIVLVAPEGRIVATRTSPDQAPAMLLP